MAGVSSTASTTITVPSTLAPGTYCIGAIADSTGVQPEAKEAGRSRKIHKVAVPAVVSARMKSGLSQTAFAQLLGVSVRTVQDWEQGRRQPSGAAKMLIAIAERRPRVLLEAANS